MPPKTASMTSAHGAVLAVLLILATPPAKAVDGAADPTFNGNGRAVIGVGSSAFARAVAAQPDGKVVVAGQTHPSPNVLNTDFLVARRLANGAPDGTFGGPLASTVLIPFDLGAPSFVHDGATALAVQPDGRIVVCGYADLAVNERRVAVARLTAAGALDPTFGGGDGKLTLPVTETGGYTSHCSLLLRRDGRILLTATNNFGDNTLLQLESDGELDVDFGTGGRSDGWSCGFPSCGSLRETVEMPDGSLLTLATNTGTVELVRWIADGEDAGTLDITYGAGGIASFTPPGTAAWSIGAAHFALDRIGRVLVLVAESVDPAHAALLRVVGDQPDTSFGDGGWSPLTLPSNGVAGVSGLVVQSDGKPVIAGYTDIGGSVDFLLLRLTADAVTPDLEFSGGWRAVAFDLGGSLTDIPLAVNLSAGKVLAAGYATTDNDSRIGVARLDNALVWSDGFELGSTWLWSGSQP
jgi:uncharacterized delta-60 repeat protein